MDQQAQVTITAVQAEPKQGQRGPFTIYRVQTAQGFELTTFNDQLGRDAQMRQGQTVAAVYEIIPGKPRRDGGQFPNENRLKMLTGGDMYAQPQIPGAQGPQPTPSVPAPTALPTPPAPPLVPPVAAQVGPDMSAERELRIMRQ